MTSCFRPERCYTVPNSQVRTQSTYCITHTYYIRSIYIYEPAPSSVSFPKQNQRSVKCVAVIVQGGKVVIADSEKCFLSCAH